ncbi:hypothetical protein PVAND_003818 [Polypedilum vanderplanki]|uniref:Uncharacterized protein n=1 Tax=Polypedilum vanderplanki TaxID=319348 RepID=A0A9J6BV62_POLVA|nr:hypothetical protein PVAND_003818 [Polypedilum vanderplanki]
MLRFVFLLSAFVFGSLAHVIVQPVVQPAQPSLAHPAVIEQSIVDSSLPAELSKSARFYNNPHTAAHLAQESWFADKEHPVFDREAEKIDRHQISKIFINAGLHRRRREA